MGPEDLTSFDRLLAPQYVAVLFWIGVAASVLLGLGLMLTGGAGLLVGLAVLAGGPVLTRVGCELLILAFKAVDWIAEINATLARQQKLLAEQAKRAQRAEQTNEQQRPERLDGSSSDDVAPSRSVSQTDSADGEPQLPSSQ